MTAEVEIVLRTMLAPAAVAFALLWFCRQVLPLGLEQRFGLPAALAAGFCAGYFLQPGAELVPQRHWQWLPYLGLAAAFVGRSNAADGGRSSGGRSSAPSYVWWLACAALTIGSAWLLVPTWPKLWPSRAVSIPLVASYLLLLMGLLSALPARLLGRTFAGLLAATATSVALLVIVGVTAKIGLLGLTVAAALAGCWGFTYLPTRALLSPGPQAGRERRVDAAAKQGVAPLNVPSAGIARGLIPGFAVLVGGLAYVGTITPTTPLPIILFAPPALLGLWLFAAGPLASLKGWKAATAQAAVVFIPLGLAVVWVALVGGEDEWGQ
jgi:hypothetical protein